MAIASTALALRVAMVHCWMGTLQRDILLSIHSGNGITIIMSET